MNKLKVKHDEIIKLLEDEVVMQAFQEFYKKNFKDNGFEILTENLTPISKVDKVTIQEIINDKIKNCNDIEEIVVSIVEGQFGIKLKNEDIIKRYISVKMAERQFWLKRFCEINIFKIKEEINNFEKSSKKSDKSIIESYFKQYITWDDRISEIDKKNNDIGGANLFDSEEEKKDYYWNEIKIGEYNSYIKNLLHKKNKRMLYQFDFLGLFIYMCLGTKKYKNIDDSFKYIINQQVDKYSIDDLIKFYIELNTSIDKFSGEVKDYYIAFNELEKRTKCIRIILIKNYIGENNITLSFEDFFNLGKIIDIDNVELSIKYIREYLQCKNSKGKFEIMKEVIMYGLIFEQSIRIIINNLPFQYKVNVDSIKVYEENLKEYNKSIKKINRKNEEVNIDEILKVLKFIKSEDKINNSIKDYFRRHIKESFNKDYIERLDNGIENLMLEMRGEYRAYRICIIRKKDSGEIKKIKLT